MTASAGLTSSKGYSVAWFGGLLGGAVLGGITGAAVAGPSSDAVNGWWHDPQGALAFLIPPALALGMAVGAGVALRFSRARRAAATAAVILLLLPLALVLGVMLWSFWVLGTCVVATPLGARWLVARRFTAPPV